MPEQFGEKQHEATPYRRQQAREQGQVARSQDLASAAMLIGSLATLMYFGETIVDFFGGLAQEQLGGQAWLSADWDFSISHWNMVVGKLGAALLPIFGLMVLLAVSANLGQIGFLFLPQKLTLDIGRVSLLKGFQRLFSVSNAVRLAFGIFKILVVAAAAFWCLWSERQAILSLSELETIEIARFIIELVFWICLKIGVALLILAIFDYGYQRWKHEQDLRMTTQEVREELKTLQGDPQITARRRAIQRQLVVNRISRAVPRADVVVTNPTELAVALEYDPETMDAPVLVAKGAGVLAQRIRRIALEHSIPIVQRKELAQVLYKHVDVGRPIPPEQYAAMAEVLRYVYQLNGKTLPAVEQAA